MRIYVSNVSTVVSNSQLQSMISAINPYLLTLCNDWNLQSIQLFQAFTSTRGTIPPYTIFIMDNTDSPGALGYHFESSGVPIGKVFAKTILNYGGAVLYKDNRTMTVAQCLCHEIMEMIGNEQTNKWYMDNDGSLWCGELCDAVENNLYVVTLPNNVKVGLSDYVLPSYFTPDCRRRPFNKMNTLTSPFSLDSGGYSILIRNNRVVEIFGSTVTESKKQEVISDANELRAKFNIN